jgi:alpha-mannosidase
LGRPATASVAECAFAAVTRGDAEGGPQEPALATFPSRRWVSAGGLTVHHQGLLEYELVGGRALALTLLRATGILSRPAPPARPNVAGPAVVLVDPQLPGRRSFRYAVALETSDPWALADHLWTDLQPVAAAGGGTLPDRGCRLAIEPGGARVSALYRGTEGNLEIRVFNPRRTAATVVLPGRSGAVIDLAGTALSEWSGQVILGPSEVATLRLNATSLD